MKHADLLIFSLVILLNSCSKFIIDNDDASGESLGNLIEWSVSAVENTVSPGTRALIDEYNDLQEACTSYEVHEAEKIGLLGKAVSEGSTETVFDNVDLWWWEKPKGNPFQDQTDSFIHWNYEGEDRYWKDNADYVFKAYFPKSKVILQPGSNADELLTVYDTQQAQFDLMVAHKAMRSQSENPVKLEMRHALAALKFDFRFVEGGVTDNLICCWMENTGSDGFYTSSTLNFTSDIVWPRSSQDAIGVPLYYWEPSSPLRITSSTAVSAYSTSAAEDKGRQYTDNSGWLLIIPQISSSGHVDLCFKTSTGGNTVYRITLPSYDYQAGNRYNYHIKMTSTGIELALTIADWNERKSSYEIDFND